VSERIAVLEGDELLAFSFEDLMRYHGPGSPGGVAHAFKVMQRAFPLLAGGGPPQRREILIRTAFGGPGARDGFELVTRAVSDGRLALDPSLERPERGPVLARFVFELAYRGEVVTLVARAPFVLAEVIALARQTSRTAAEEARLRRLKREMADLVTGRPADEVYEVAR
jgi:hypothetical protein